MYEENKQDPAWASMELLSNPAFSTIFILSCPLPVTLNLQTLNPVMNGQQYLGTWGLG